MRCSHLMITGVTHRTTWTCTNYNISLSKVFQYMRQTTKLHLPEGYSLCSRTTYHEHNRYMCLMSPWGWASRYQQTTNPGSVVWKEKKEKKHYQYISTEHICCNSLAAYHYQNLFSSTVLFFSTPFFQVVTGQHCRKS